RVDEGERCTLSAGSGAPLEAFAHVGMPRDAETFAAAFDDKGVVRSDDIARDPRCAQDAPCGATPTEKPPVRSYLAMPVVSRSGQVIGRLFFGHAEPGKCTQMSEHGVASLAAEAAVAIDNARLVQEAKNE